MSASSKGKLVLWYRLENDTYDCRAERRDDEVPGGVVLLVGKHNVSRVVMLDLFLVAIKDAWTQEVYVDPSDGGVEYQISARTVERIKTGEFTLEDLLIQ